MDRTTVMNAMKAQGISDAQDLQNRAKDMNGTELNAEDNKIPSFKADVQYLNYPSGFVCKSSSGNVVKLLQPYDSTIYTGQPEELPAQWGFQWSTDPSKAKPFIALSTSPYMTGDCCTENGNTYRSKIDNNVWAPSAHPTGWELVEV